MRAEDQIDSGYNVISMPQPDALKAAGGVVENGGQQRGRRPRACRDVKPLANLGPKRRFGGVDERAQLRSL